MTHGAVFLVNLLQDVSVIRPLARLTRELGYPVSFLTSHSFLRRDSKGRWNGELRTLAAALDATTHVYDSPLAAYQLLQGRGGVIVAASELDVRGHDLTHDVFRCAPPGFRRITLQHGYECVGFLHNRDHDRAHGHSVRFAADIICGWAEAPALRSIVPSERTKLVVTGPTSQLMPLRQTDGDERDGLVCENLHSVRLNGHGGLKLSFMDCFTAFADHCRKSGTPLTLRPHPGGRYVLKNNVPLPPEVRIDQSPIYKAGLGDFAFGISAPSSVLLDMLFAKVPAALWQDGGGQIDASNYAGLTAISAAEEWAAFARDAVHRRDYILERQEAFLAAARLIHRPEDVRKRFARVMSEAIGSTAGGRARALPQ